MKAIKLTQDKETIVDDEDFEFLTQFRWHARKDSGYNFYAQRTVWLPESKTWKIIHMHRIIMNPPNNLFIDHINHNGLDNRKENLRIVTHSQNHFNERIRKDNTSGHKGIYFNKRLQKWVAVISNKHLGVFSNIENAVKCRADFINNIK